MWCEQKFETEINVIFCDVDQKKLNFENDLPKNSYFKYITWKPCIKQMFCFLLPNICRKAVKWQILLNTQISVIRRNTKKQVTTFYGSVWWRYPTLTTFSNSKHFCLLINSYVIQQLDYSFARLDLRFAFWGLIETFYVNYPWFNFKATLVLSPNMQTYIIYVNS